MKNNYDLILNFETNDGKPLSEEAIDFIIGEALELANSLEEFENLTVWKAIISQAVESVKTL